MQKYNSKINLMKSWDSECFLKKLKNLGKTWSINIRKNNKPFF